MSSFIIGKVEYVKAAGLMYGIEEVKRHKHSWFLENVRKEFEHCYALNVISVNEQYNTNNAPEEESYDVAFEEHRQLVHTIYKREIVGSDFPVRMKDLRLRLQSFFEGCLYQIENKACERAVAAWFYKCIVKLYEDDVDAVDGWHSRVELKEDITKLKAA